jgi:hypothetical protein
MVKKSTGSRIGYTNPSMAGHRIAFPLDIITVADGDQRSLVVDAYVDRLRCLICSIVKLS